MSLRPFISVPTNIREWTKWCKEAIVTGSVGTAELEDEAVTLVKLAQLTALSVIGNATNATADPTAITAAANDRIFSRTANALGFTQLTAGMFPNAVVPDAALSANVAVATTSFFTGTLTGCTTVPTVSIQYAKCGSVVSLFIPTLTGVSNSVAATITGAPVAIRPTNTQTLLVRIMDNSATALGLATIDSAGLITLSTGVGGAGAFTAANNKGLVTTSVSYPLV